VVAGVGFFEEGVWVGRGHVIEAEGIAAKRAVLYLQEGVVEAVL
jgi:hypothetical protein